MYNVEKLKKEIECFTIQDLADIIRTEPLILEKNSIFNYNKKQREELKSCMLEIAKRTLDLAELESKFLKENIKKIEKKIFITNEEDKAELKELMKVCLDKRTYNALKDLFSL